MKKIFLILIVFFSFFLISFASSNVCCFYPSSGVCSERVPSNVCTENQGRVVGTLCGSSAECSLGCCILGLETKYVNQRTCELEARTKGFEMQWVGGASESACSSMAGRAELVACVYELPYENQCKFIEKNKCSGKIYEGKICSDPSLNTVCKKTNKTKCFEDGNVYYVDSCGNRDTLVQECKYSDGFLCQQKNSKEAYCKSLNCIDKWGNSRKNGESWCVGLDGNVLLTNLKTISFVKTKEKPKGFNDGVGSRFFKQSCIDEEVITEPCEDYRNEVCIPEGNQAKCVANQGDKCFDSNVFDEETQTNKIEDCDKQWCYVSRLDDCVSFPGDIDASTGKLRLLCLEERNRWRSYAAERGLSTDGVLEVSSDILKDLNLPMCLPKVTLGSDISKRSGISNQEKESICSIGNYEGKVWLDHDMGSGDYRWWIKGNENAKTTVDKSEKKYGNAGLISLDINNWNFARNDQIHWCDIPSNPLNLDKSNSCNNDVAWCCGGDEYYINKKAIDKAISEEKITDPIVIELLNERTVGIGDCVGSLNWLGEEGKNENSPKSFAKRGTSDRTDHMLFSFSFKAKPWAPPLSGDCSLCGADGLPCSEYRCKAIAKNCEYKEPRGINTGVCVRSNDFTGPTISFLQEPKNPIPPYSAVKITINTNEDSYCKFDFKSGGVNIDNMKYETDGRFARAHEFVLTAPRAAIDDEDVQKYPLLTKDGKYEIFVMCEDGAGNTRQEILKLEVMKTPDEIPASILEFIPPSNSFVEFNKTTKKIKFKINEPAECRWDFDRTKDYDEMGSVIENEEKIYKNNFLCNNEINEETTAKGYWCEGELNNITTEIGNSTKFYIKCKDQPWLEGKEDQYYKRNKNPYPKEYVLKPSKSLEILDFVPRGDYVVGSDKQNLTIQLKTKEGAERGKAECKWRLKINNLSSSWKYFNRTNSTTHTDSILNLEEGLYKIDVKCEDIAENKVNASYDLNIVVDKLPPKLLRAYNDRGSLKISLDEKANCKFSNFGGCTFVLTNGTSLDKIKENEFRTNLKKGTPYFIRCEDIFGNSACYPEIVVY